MKLNKILLLQGVAAMMILSCCSSKDDSVADGEKKALNVSSASITASTRGVYDTGGALSDGSSIGLYSYGTGYSDSNVKYTCNSSIWSAADPSKCIYLGGNVATIVAYAPYTSSFQINNTTLSPSQYTEANDLCVFSVSNVSAAAPSVSLSLKHVYSRITFSIDKDANYTRACHITDIALSGPGIYGTAIADFTPSASSLLSGKIGGVVDFNPQISSITSGIPQSVSFLMIPASASEFTGPTVITFTVDGLSYSATLSVSDLNALSAGSNYNIKVKVTPTTILLSGVTVNPWNVITSGTLNPAQAKSVSKSYSTSSIDK